MENDSQLLKAFLTNRNENAFRSLVERHADWCYGIALRLVNNNTHLAEEVCQTAFTRLAQNASKLRHRKTVGGWLYYSVKYIAANKIRSEMRRKTNEEAYAMQTESETQETSIDWQEASPALNDVLSRLSETDRDAVCLRYFEGLNFAQIGARLGLKENTARMRLNRALEKLQGLMATRGIRASAGALGTGLSAQIACSAPAGFAVNAANLALASAAAGSGAAGLLGALLFMKTKIVSISAVAAALLAGGVATKQWSEAETSRTKLEAARDENLTLSKRVQELETKLAAARAAAPLAEANATEVEETNSENKQARPSTPPPPELTQDYVMSQYQKGKTLLKSGNYAEAAESLFWVLDVGTKQVSSTKGYRNVVIDLLAKIGKEDGNVQRGLATRRDAIEQDILAHGDRGMSDYEDLRTWRDMNEFLGEESRSLEVLDQIEDPRLSREMRRLLTGTLVDAQRYEEAVQPGMGARAFSQFEQLLQQQSSPNLGEDQRKLVQEHRHRLAVEHMGVALEALAGAGKREEALELIENVLARDRSPDTLAAVNQRLQRANSLWLLDYLEGNASP